MRLFLTRSGFAVAPIMVLALVCLLLTFTLVGLTTFQLNASQKSQTSEQAFYLAQGALSMTLSGLHDGLATNTPFNQPVTFAPFPDRPDAIGQVSFNTSTPWGYSTNNFTGSPVPGWGGVTVQPGMANILARGVFGDSIRTIDAWVRIPQYQYVLAVDGALASVGPILARQEPAYGQLYADAQANTPNTTLPASIGSNTSISAGNDSIISGDVVCPGAVLLGPGAQIGGSIDVQHITAPGATVAAFRNNSPDTPLLTSSMTSGLAPYALSIDSYAPTDLVFGGNLQLQNAYLFVDGRLTINGSITGNGAVFATNSITITGGANVSATDTVAVMATGDVSVSGSGVGSYFQGLVYTEGRFTASNVTIAGAFVSANSSEGNGSGSTINLQPNVQVVYVPTATDIQLIGTNTGPTLTINNLFNSGNQFEYSPPLGGTTYSTATPPNGTGINFAQKSGWVASALQPTNNANTQMYNSVQAALGPTTTSLLQGHPCNNSAPQPQLLSPGAFPVGAVDVAMADGSTWRIQVESTQFDSGSGQFVPVSPAIVLIFSLSGTPTHFYDPTGFDAAAASQGLTSTQFVNALTSAQSAMVNVANPMLPDIISGAGQSSPNLDLSLNRFLSTGLPVHVVSWFEL